MILKNLILHQKKDEIITQVVITAGILLLLNLVAMNFWPTEYLLIFDLVIIAFLFTLRFTQVTFYIMILLYPFIGWQIEFGSINAPLVDFVGIAIAVAWLLKTVFNFSRQNFSWQSFPGLIYVLLFFVAGILSLINAEVFSSALKYLIRPIIFFYLIFVLIPFNFIKTKEQLYRVLKILLFVGVVVAIIGFLPVIFGGDSWYERRATPFIFGDFDPIGGNQNAIAEIMVITLPIALIILSKIKNYRLQSSLVILSGFLLLVLLLTFSRSGYLALLLQLIILIVFRFKKQLAKSLLVPLIILFMALPALFYFSVWQEIDWVRSSNTSRLALTEIAWDAFLQHPIIGNGAGSFQSIVGDTFAFIVDFGDPLDSHGFVQKIAVEQGILGLIFYLGFLLYLTRLFIRAFGSERDEQEKFEILCFFMLFAGIILFELFSTSYYLPRVWIPIAVALAGLNLYDNKLFKKTL
ncbi:hypothetical protein A2223_03385 [Candidatus Falkowbacteria bacterium RIFOXYA2_FULL_35_8]|uniref:O-antigen ligase-related domain-containing protein n=1 Tax=Candidatus Falkowbacteria bacterium RIFOXYC2_FULL_36_12 TaxID=1798002 RepID=A0A1F5SZ90_9BACT|nr:MAG: hypothetical protein A2300_01940 [Candidatus Falkowbacteria bacterium RIFOXYB2_FULL_35_7]OGF31773.1 MAG: hypothetical protein A2478_04785 [Candidatus Falkowbacteria bacterium RIFOXYC2_FULL_36_12]OGF33099.1 MAG: hypothetical protein A2223_03385 [Candidatus Falkowbacteria bacterium RIFOXYA2_FULL_35_8]